MRDRVAPLGGHAVGVQAVVIEDLGHVDRRREAFDDAEPHVPVLGALERRVVAADGLGARAAIEERRDAGVLLEQRADRDRLVAVDAGDAALVVDPGERRVGEAGLGMAVERADERFEEDRRAVVVGRRPGEELAARVREAGVERARQAAVLLVHDHDARIAKRVEVLARAVGRAVVHDHELEVAVGLGEDAADRFRQETEVVVDREDDRHARVARATGPEDDGRRCGRRRGGARDLLWRRRCGRRGRWRCGAARARSGGAAHGRGRGGLGVAGRGRARRAHRRARGHRLREPTRQRDARQHDDRARVVGAPADQLAVRHREPAADALDLGLPRAALVALRLARHFEHHVRGLEREEVREEALFVPDVVVDGVDRDQVDRRPGEPLGERVLAADHAVELGVRDLGEERQHLRELDVLVVRLDADRALYLRPACHRDVEHPDVRADVEVRVGPIEEAGADGCDHRDARIIGGTLARDREARYLDRLVDALVAAVVERREERAGGVEVAGRDQRLELGRDQRREHGVESLEAGETGDAVGRGRHLADVAEARPSDDVERALERHRLRDVAGLLEVDEHGLVAAEHEVLLVEVGVDDAAHVERPHRRLDLAIDVGERGGTEPLCDRLERHELLEEQERVVAVLRVAVHDRHEGQVGEALELALLVPQ